MQPTSRKLLLHEPEDFQYEKVFLPTQIHLYHFYYEDLICFFFFLKFAFHCNVCSIPNSYFGSCSFVDRARWKAFVKHMSCDLYNHTTAINKAFVGLLVVIHDLVPLLQLVIPLPVDDISLLFMRFAYFLILYCTY